MSMTREKALETIAVVLQHTETDCDYAYDNADGSVDLLPGQDIADALRLALAALQEQAERRWIPVTEQLPEDLCPVLVTLKGLKVAFVGRYQESEWWSEGAGSRPFVLEVTHWMPMPAKEGT